MADVNVTSQAENYNDGLSRSTYVWISHDQGYVFRLRAGSGSNDARYLDYYTTTDAGENWSPSLGVNIHDSGATERKIGSHDVWWDQRTPSDSGTIIHILVWSDVGSSNAQAAYYQLDTDGDTLTIKLNIDFDSGGALGESCSITKMEDGSLYAAFEPSNVHEVWRSIDAGATWAQLSADPSGADRRDKHVLYPTASADNRDAMRLLWGIGTDELSVDIWDDSAGTWTKTVIESPGDFVVKAGDLTVGQGWSSTFRRSDKTVLVCIHEDSDFNSHDLRLFEVIWDGSSLTVTEKTSIYVAQTNGMGVAITLGADEAIYVYYTVGSLGSQFITRVKSTDGGGSWGSAVQQSDETEDYTIVISAPQIVGLGRLHPLFSRGSGSDSRIFYQFLDTTSPEGKPLPIEIISTFLRLELDDYVPFFGGTPINIILVLPAHEWREQISTKAFVMTIPGFEATPIALNYVELVIQVKGICAVRLHEPHPLTSDVNHLPDFRDLEEAAILFNKQVLGARDAQGDKLPARRSRLILPLLDADRVYDGVIQSMTLVHNPGTDETDFILKFAVTWNPSNPAMREWN